MERVTVLVLLGLCGALFVGSRAQYANWRQRFPYLDDSSNFANIQDQVFDFIVVGGGTAGCPLAATLSAKFKVLVLERGGVPYDQPSVYRLEGFPWVLSTRAAEKFRSVDGVENRRGTVVGGTSSVNAGFYSRAPRDFIARMGWDKAVVQKSYKWVEKLIVSQPVPGKWQQAYRGSLLEAKIRPWRGHSFDHKIGTKLGNSIFDSNGTRHTAADLLANANSSNIKVLYFATVLKIIFAPSSGPGPREALGVLFRDSNRVTWQARLRPGGEVLLTAGALGSPQLLLLSGVGPRRDLAALNIPLVADLPGVGQNVTDIPMNAFNVFSPIPVEETSLQVVGISRAGIIIEAGSGGNHSVCWGQAGQSNDVPPAQRTDLLNSMAEAMLRTLPQGVKDSLNQAGFILSKVYRPLSRGRLWLKAADVDVIPEVQYNYYSHIDDVNTCVRGTTYLHRILASRSLAKYRYTTVPTFLRLLYPSLAAIPSGSFEGSIPVLPPPGNYSAAAKWCKDTATTVWHFHGGCRAPECVGSDYRVKGLRGVRVIDGSTWPTSPGTNPMATCLMLGRYMGLQILKERGFNFT